jgi:GDP-D-mannose dehydratase
MDAVILNPVQPDALYELAASLNLRSSLDCPNHNTAQAENKHETTGAEGWRRLPMVASR